MFQSIPHWLPENPAQLHYGVAMIVLEEGEIGAFIAGFQHPNRLLTWDGSKLVDRADATLRDPNGLAIGVAAADLDADGREEIYVLNTDAYSGPKRHPDRLFARSKADRGWVDWISDPARSPAIDWYAGRSVAAIDRHGSGRYGFVLTNYGGPLRLIESEPDGRLVDHAESAGLAWTTGGRGLLTGPLLGQGMDLFANNERGPNYLFRNDGQGRFVEEAERLGLSDPHEHGRGVTALDADGDGRFELIAGNWQGPHRYYVPSGHGRFEDRGEGALVHASRIRTVLAADFDNDGYLEAFLNHLGQPNRLLRFLDGAWQSIDPGPAVEPDGFGTGAAVADLDGDGILELVSPTARWPLSRSASTKSPIAITPGFESVR